MLILVLDTVKVKNGGGTVFSTVEEKEGGTGALPAYVSKKPERAVRFTVVADFVSGRKKREEEEQVILTILDDEP